ncbi:MAG: class I SAM-dependent methyltransferase [Nitrospirota bacterium]
MSKEGVTEKTICRRAATVQFWDSYARWYKLWMAHNNYHGRIIEVLTTMVKPGWKVLDIGAGNGVLALPLSAVGCDVTALEPSTGMRSLLYEEAFGRGIDWITVDERRWEDIPCFELKDYDLIMACNSLHLTEMGFAQAIEKTFYAKPKNIFVVTELGSPEIKVKWQYGDYKMVFTKCYETESSFAYHTMDEVFEHWSYKKGRMLYPDEEQDIKSMLTIEDCHLWIKDTAYVGMYWWEGIVGGRR